MPAIALIIIGAGLHGQEIRGNVATSAVGVAGKMVLLPLVVFGAGFDSLLNPGELHCARPADDVAMFLYTSGSTGRPKGVPLTHRGHLWVVDTRVAALDRRDHRVLVAAPLYHMNALAVSIEIRS